VRHVGDGDGAQRGFQGDRDDVELSAPGEGVIEFGQHSDMLSLEGRINVGDHPHRRRRIHGVGVGDQLTQVRVVGEPELNLNDHRPVPLVSCGKIQAHPSHDPVTVGPGGDDGPPFTDHDLPASILQPLQVKTGGEAVEIVGQPRGEVGFSRPPSAGIADDPVAGGRADADAVEAIKGARRWHGVSVVGPTDNPAALLRRRDRRRAAERWEKNRVLGNGRLW
jgi:hypothetical protein